jgi:hypothetical protein
VTKDGPARRPRSMALTAARTVTRTDYGRRSSG